MRSMRRGGCTRIRWASASWGATGWRTWWRGVRRRSVVGSGRATSGGRGLRGHGPGADGQGRHVVDLVQRPRLLVKAVLQAAQGIGRRTGTARGRPGKGGHLAQVRVGVLALDIALDERRESGLEAV